MHEVHEALEELLSPDLLCVAQLAYIGILFLLHDLSLISGNDSPIVSIMRKGAGVPVKDASGALCLDP